MTHTGLEPYPSVAATEWLERLQTGQLSSVELTRLLIDRIQAVNGSINALVVDRFELALEEAATADQIRLRGGPLGRLHGLPVTIKEMFDVQGLPTTVGLDRRRAMRVTRDAEVVRRWRAAGAIVLGKTNVPQMGLLAESDNPVYGRTNNPLNLERTCGGSSGGEAALIAAGGSVLGMASDGGGSIRVPAHFCGVCGFKPTGGRLPLQGHWVSANWPSDWAQPGPIAAHVGDLRLGLMAAERQSSDPIVYGEVPTRDFQNSRPLRGLRVGMYESLPELPASDTCRRAVQRAAATLADAGAEIQPFEFPRPADAWKLFLVLFYAEGLRDLQRQSRGSVIDPRVRELFRFAKLPRVVRPAIARWLDLRGQRRAAAMVRDLEAPVLTAERYCQRLLEMHVYRQHVVRQMNRAGVEILLGPVAPTAAFPHNEFYANFAMIYTAIFNLLGWPVGVVSAARVRPEETQVPVPTRDWVDQARSRAIAGSSGLPVGVQIAAPWWCDSLVLDVMEHLEGSWRESGSDPDRRPALDVK